MAQRGPVHKVLKSRFVDPGFLNKKFRNDTSVL